MYYYIAHQNAQNELLNLHSNETFCVKNITGLGYDSNPDIAKSSGYDGGQYTATTLPPREIKIEFLLNSRFEETAVLEHFISKQKGVFFYSDKKIECFVSSVSINKLTRPVVCEVKLICPFPYFTDKLQQIQTMTLTEPLLEFPLFFDPVNKNMLSNRTGSVFRTITNKSSVDVYPVVEFTAFSTVDMPSLMNIHTYEKMELCTTLSAGEKIVIDTRVGQKSITKYTGYSEKGENFFNSIAEDFVFYPLYVGDNKLKFDAESGIEGLFITINYDTLYGGV